ncbi:MAG TPA: PEP-CTERM sorting domain-containing protein [Methylibium sp.]|nr:PEP-CTERM sorting domain-containing protein [Methylibium sp.]
MNKSLLGRLSAAVATATIAGAAHAATFTPTFSDYAFPGSQFTVDAAANAFFNTNYGIVISNAYLYVDSRDTFDGIGIANGTVAGIGTPQSGRIDFTDTTDFVSIDYLAILDTSYNAFAGDGSLLDSFAASSGVGSFTLNGGASAIAYLTFSSTGGFGAVSGLTYNYDGITDGRNDDLPGTTPPIPEPSTYALMLAGLGLVGWLTRRNRAVQGSSR